MLILHQKDPDDIEAVLRLVRHKHLRRLVQYWFERRDGRLVTRRDDIDPVEMPGVLPYVWLYDHEPDTGRFRCRLAGEEIRALYQTNIVGKYLDEFLLAMNWPLIEGHYRAVVELPAVGHAIGEVYRKSLDRVGVGERIVMPLSDADGVRVTMLLGATVYRDVSDVPVQVDERIDRVLIPLVLRK